MLLVNPAVPAVQVDALRFELSMSHASDEVGSVGRPMCGEPWAGCHSYRGRGGGGVWLSEGMPQNPPCLVAHCLQASLLASITPHAHSSAPRSPTQPTAGCTSTRALHLTHSAHTTDRGCVLHPCPFPQVLNMAHDISTRHLHNGADEQAHARPPSGAYLLLDGWPESMWRKHLRLQGHQLPHCPSIGPPAPFRGGWKVSRVSGACLAQPTNCYIAWLWPCKPAGLS